MTLQLHNTLTKKTEVFAPKSDNTVKLYTCGPTVYDYLHVGNWSAYIYWDTLVRTLIANDFSVDRVMNITDVGHLVSDADDGEDKLEKGARREGKTAWDVATFYGNDFITGMKRLNLIAPEHITKATEYIPQQLDLVRKLKEKGFTYQIDDGIYFDTAKFPTYADFAGLDLDAQQAGARVALNEQKRHAADFALWKFTPAGEKRDMEWETPAELVEDGRWKMEDGERRANSHLPDSNSQPMGFPGWHLECSAMAMSILGNTLDIHTGGIDHIPVHHTNEIAQSEAASGVTFSNYWLHNNHLKVEGTKISKSLSNGYTLDTLEKRGYSPLDYRLFVLQSHYRSESNFTFENLTGAKNRRHNWRNIAALRHQTHDTLTDDSQKEISLRAAPQALLEALNDDLNTPRALTIIDQAFAEFDGVSITDIHQSGLGQLLEQIDKLLGLALIESTPDITDGQKQLVVQRQRAREDKNWTESDRIRDELAKNGITIRDTVHGPIWEYI